MDSKSKRIIQSFRLLYLANKDASIVLCTVVKHLHVGNGGVALKKKATSFVSATLLLCSKASASATACFTAEQSTVEAPLFVLYNSRKDCMASI